MAVGEQGDQNIEHGPRLAHHARLKAFAQLREHPLQARNGGPVPFISFLIHQENLPQLHERQI